MKTRAVAVFAALLAMTARGSTAPCVASELPEWAGASDKKKAALLTLCPAPSNVDATAEDLRYRTVAEGNHAAPANGLAIGGVVVFAAGYLPAVLSGLLAGDRTPLGLIPIAGPIFLSAHWWSSGGGLYALANALIVLASSAELGGQVAGVLMFIVGMNSPSRRGARDARPRVSLVPSAAGAPLGASLVGRF